MSAEGLLLVHAHPDDECMTTGGSIARAAAEGRRVDLVTCTGGEEGEIHDPTLDEAEARPRLREIRRGELDCAIAALGGGAVRLHLLGYRDSGMMGTEANERPEAFWQADLDEAIGKLVAIVREARPSVMVSYDPNGNYGHPDHINAHRIAIGAWEAAADPQIYPDAGAPHAVAKFYETAFSREAMLAMMLEMHARGLELPWDFGEAIAKAREVAGEALAAGGGAGPWDAGQLNPTNVDAMRQVAEALAGGAGEPADWGTPDELVTTRADVAAYVRQKRAAMDCHRTQRQDFGWMLDLPDDLADRVMSTEHYVLTRWRGHDGDLAGVREGDLFAGL
jgi:N-acetyl-1-D-myo-inositol-2-amino-2-deoxy-alpha-D-glucopyranoside deacetylase